MSTSSRATVGIIGAGNIGQAFARLTSHASRNAIISNSTGPASLKPPLGELGSAVSAGTAIDAAEAPIVVLAVPWPNIPEAVAGLTWDNRIVIDATNAVTVTFEAGVPTFTALELDGKTSSEIVAGLVPGARVVKAGNTLFAPVLAADPREGGGNRILFISGDDHGGPTSIAGTARFVLATFYIASLSFQDAPPIDGSFASC